MEGNDGMMDSFSSSVRGSLHSPDWESDRNRNISSIEWVSGQISTILFELSEVGWRLNSCVANSGYLARAVGSVSSGSTSSEP
jgi:hypothetical protein